VDSRQILSENERRKKRLKALSERDQRQGELEACR